jgi:choline dehydrogenase
VEKLLFEGNRVTGVRLASGDLKANKEVILSAGAIGSPQLLMVSGIGAAEQLTPHKIKMVKELPGVGQNLQDHLQARPVFKCASSTINTEINSWFKQGLIGLEYLLKRTGPMTMASSLGTGFVKTHLSPDRPDIQFHIQPFSADSPAEGPHKFNAFTASVLQMRPESTGHLSLVSNRFADHPDIHPNYLATELDQQTLLAGIKITQLIAQQEPLKSLITEEYSPGISVGASVDADILNWARDTASTIYHPTGTCKMGHDDMAVVNAQLKVHGIEGLRVADASIMPIITSGNTNAPVIMIGEKAAAMILQEIANV